VTLSSAGKLFSLTGWRVAWVVGPSRLLGPISYAHTHLTYCAPTPLQVLLSLLGPLCAHHTGAGIASVRVVARWRVEDAVLHVQLELSRDALYKNAVRMQRICNAYATHAHKAYNMIHVQPMTHDTIRRNALRRGARAGRHRGRIARGAGQLWGRWGALCRKLCASC